jgi:hypothetical protein
VIDEQPAPDGGAGMYLDPGQGAPELGHNPPKQALTVAPEPMGWAVEEQNMHARIGKEHLYAGARSRVPGNNRIEMLANALENHDRRRGKVFFAQGEGWLAP